MLGVHDNEIISYEVDFQNCRIVLHTLSGSNDIDTTAIVFNDVLTHMFETQLRGSVILDVRKHEVIQFVKHNKELLEKQKNYGWPIHYEKIEDLLEYLQSRKYNYYIISASYGLNGWIIAKEYDICN